MTHKVELSQWHGCYDQQWAGVITSASMAHPAKYSRGLIERIYRHCLERGYLNKGDLVGDCFGGVGTGGVMGAYAGLRWIGVELEKRFVSMARRNFALHTGKWKTLGCPRPVILQGDSRKFDALVRLAAGVISSPPFLTARSDTTGSCGGIMRDGYSGDGEVDSGIGDRHYKGTGGERSTGNIETLPAGDLSGVLTSPPYAESIRNVESCGTDPAASDRKCGPNSQQASRQGYGEAAGQIGRLPPGDLSAVVSSPPREDNSEGSRKAHKMGSPEKILACNRGHGASDAAVLAQAARDEAKIYGDSPGQIGKLKGGDLQAVVSSPPYQEGLGHDSGHPRLDDKEDARRSQEGCARRNGYGYSEAQIQGETYWQAVRDVYASCHRAIKPTGVLVLVLKDYVKNKKRVPLADDTVTLCESLGFVLIERIQAMLVSETRHGDLFNGEDVKQTSRKSFFRRLAESKGSPKIDNEDVLIFRRP